MAFTVMGIVILVQPKKGSKYMLGGILWLLAGFGLIHGFNEFLDMWAIIKSEGAVSKITHIIILIISYIFLFEFSRRLFCISYLDKRTPAGRAFFPWWIAPLIICVAFVLAITSPDFWENLKIWVRYILGLSGAIMASVGFMLFYKSNKREFRRLKVKRYFYLAGGCFFLYGLLGGLVVDEGSVFLSHIINTRHFISVVHFPVEAMRAMCALGIAYAVYGIIQIFYWENVEVLRRTTDDLRLEYQAGQEKVKQIERLLAVKTQFVSMVSHELRTPLTAIKANIDVVLSGGSEGLDPERKAFLNVACDNVDRLSKLINDVLGFQSLERGKVKYEFGEYDINEIIWAEAEMMLPLIKEKKLDFTLNLEKDLPRIRIDRDRIIQVLNNLINNAIKYTDKGGITISSKRGKRLIDISVEDTGCGIKENDLSKLFEPFTQINKKGGAGLGLSICREIINAHKGKIWAESEFDKGSNFRFVLPAERSG